MPRQKTHDEYILELKNKAIDIDVLDKYINTGTKILHQCQKCGYKWMALPKNVLIKKDYCPICNKGRILKHEEYLKILKNKNLNISVIEPYKNKKTKILHKCKVCDHEWLTTPENILNGGKCPMCSNHKKRTHLEYIKELYSKHPNIKVKEKFQKVNYKILHQCEKCRYEWFVTPHNILKSNGCPVCTFPPKKIGPSPEYKNSIWASKYRDYFSNFLTEQQMKTHMPHSNKKIKAKCPDCNNIKEIKIMDLLEHGLSCICKDKQSYPNKFMYAFLQQLNIKFIPEYSPKWAKRKRYDIYIPEYNIIIENHGIQHYKEFKGFGKTLEEQQSNDKFKKELALNNNIQYYIELDCQKSNLLWIKKSILNSDLLKIINVNNSIDWMGIDKKITVNSVKKCAELWNAGCTKSEIEKVLNLGHSTVYNYLKKAAMLKMCDYTPQKSKKRGKEKYFGKYSYDNSMKGDENNE